MLIQLTSFHPVAQGDGPNTFYLGIDHILTIGHHFKGSAVHTINGDEYKVAESPEEVVKKVGIAMLGFQSLTIQEVPAKAEYTVLDRLCLMTHLLHESISVIDNPALGVALDTCMKVVERALKTHSNYLQNFNYKFTSEALK